MPELPDLQVFSHNLQQKLKGKSVHKIGIVNKKRIKETEGGFNKALAGASLQQVYREGKELRFLFDNGALLGLHLMLHGKMVLFEKKNTEKNTVAAIYFDDESGLAITDFQGMALLSLNPEEKESPDALSRKLTPAYLKQTLSHTRKKIKEVLLDQQLIRGIGNAYADEILWDAGISPFSVSGKIPPGKISALAKSIKKVLKAAEKRIIKKHPGIIAGEVRDFLLIHNPDKKHSPSGALIKHTDKSRKTYYTDEQELYK